MKPLTMTVERYEELRRHDGSSGCLFAEIEALAEENARLTTERDARTKALEAICEIDFKRSRLGGIDFYSGPSVFIEAWFLAFRALGREVPEPALRMALPKVLPGIPEDPRS